MLAPKDAVAADLQPSVFENTDSRLVSTPKSNMQKEYDVEPAIASTWTDAAELLSILDTIAKRGTTTTVKVDGLGDSDRRYAVVVSGSPLGDRFLRKDGANLSALLREPIEFYDTNSAKARD